MVSANLNKYTADLNLNFKYTSNRCKTPWMSYWGTGTGTPPPPSLEGEEKGQWGQTPQTPEGGYFPPKRG